MINDGILVGIKVESGRAELEELGLEDSKIFLDNFFCFLEKLVIFIDFICFSNLRLV